MRKRLYGEENRYVLASLNTLGQIFHQQNNLREAEGKFTQALDMEKRLSGTETRNYAAALNNRALVLRDEGRLTEAENDMKVSLAIRQKLFKDPQHPSSIACQNDLSNVGALARNAATNQVGAQAP